ncbi:MAG: tetratricopeptide repeat protein [Gemmataceae bacterium]|nr:tetratricopeptide repeat protein [Gemmataceae bacterium]MDW8264899.1 tetratricopeptide repeat protein [Gemmataceae bacterium]
MDYDPYSPCPCGSGKKFKWCCQPIHAHIDKAFAQEKAGQHDAALRTMAQVTAEHSGNPEAWGRYAQLLFMNDQVEEAEKALDKAFAINPNYAFGYLLRGKFRQYEGERAGALLLYRKAAQAYAPEAHHVLASLYVDIARGELSMNRPVAAHAAFRIALRHDRGFEEVREALDNLFGDKSDLPASARREYTLRAPTTSLDPAQRQAWEESLEQASAGRLADVARVFEQLTEQFPEEPAAWYNLGIARAWLGDNRRALEALDRYVALEQDEEAAAAAWALGEVLRQGAGMEDDSDYLQYHYVVRIRDPQRLEEALKQLHAAHRLMSLEVTAETGGWAALILAPTTRLVSDTSAPQIGRPGAYIFIFGDAARLWSHNREDLDKIKDELQQLTSLGLAVDGPVQVMCRNFAEVGADSMAIPIKVGDKSEMAAVIREEVRRFYEETWIHRPRRSLGGVAPIDAAGHAILRKKLLGVIRFLEECSRLDRRGYDLNRLRQKLGLGAGATAGEAGVPTDLSALSAAELAGLAVESLSDEQLEQAYQAALKLDAGDLAGHFAAALTHRPVRPERPDRYPWYAYLIQQATGEGNLDKALELVDEGMRVDCEHNEGRRRNDYEVRRGQLLAKRGDLAQAREVFDRLIQRVPSELKVYGSAAEALLGARHGAGALVYAEQGLSKARERNDRDSEQYFLELQAAAQKLARP